jgi:hypothetical protein
VHSLKTEQRRFGPANEQPGGPKTFNRMFGPTAEKRVIDSGVHRLTDHNGRRAMVSSLERR